MHDCECRDPGCPMHKPKSTCTKKARRKVFRIDMEDETGTRMCNGCADDALESGVFRSGGGR